MNPQPEILADTLDLTATQPLDLSEIRTLLAE